MRTLMKPSSTAAKSTSSTTASSTAVSMQSGYSIKEASSLTKLSASVLRMWELRYDWPKPHRRSNGYRVYNPQQIEELQRIADLLKTGLSISDLIQDGNPHWPDQEEASEPLIRESDLTLLPEAPREARELRNTITDAVKRHALTPLNEALERAGWALHPRHLLQHCYLPMAIAAYEVQFLTKLDIFASEVALIKNIKQKCQRLLAAPANSERCLIIYEHPDDELLAIIGTCMLRQAGFQASYTDDLTQEEQVPADEFIMVARAVHNDDTSIASANTSTPASIQLQALKPTEADKHFTYSFGLCQMQQLVELLNSKTTARN